MDERKLLDEVKSKDILETISSYRNKKQELYKKAVGAFVNWKKSKEQVVEILCKEGIERTEAVDIVNSIIPALNASKRKEAINNIVLGMIITIMGIALLYWTLDLKSRAKWVLWAVLLLGLKYIYGGIKLMRYHFDA
jgi:hypothetical protein